MKKIPKNVVKNHKYSYAFPIYWNSYQNGSHPMLSFGRRKLNNYTPDLYWVSYWENNSSVEKEFLDYREAKKLFVDAINHMRATKNLFSFENASR